MAVQTTYTRYLKGPTPGFETDQARSYKREGKNSSGADLDVGLGVTRVSGTDDAITQPTHSSDNLVGVVINDQGRNPNGLVSAGGGYAAGRMAPILCEGPIYVQIDQTVQPGDPVYVRYATGGSTGTGPSANVIGSFRKDGDSSGARQVKGARWLSSGTAANGVGEIYFSASAESP